MNQEKKSLFHKLNPGNFKLETKVHLLVFALVLITIMYMAVFGLTLLRNLLTATSLRHIEEIAYLKENDIETSILATERKIVDFASSEKIRFVANEFISAFRDFDSEMQNLLSERDMANELTDYYEYVLIPECPVSGEKVFNLFPVTPTSVAFQYVYILKNPKGLTEKSEFGGPEEYSAYNRVHLSNHFNLKDFTEGIGASDMMIIDPLTGDVVYTQAKNLDFGTNLFDGPLKNSPLSTVFRKAIASRRTQVFFEDFSLYTAAYDKPTAFFAAPIYFFDELQSVIVVSVNASFLDNLIYDDLEIMRSGSLEYNIIGDDLKLRNNPKDYMIGGDAYLRRLAKRMGESDTEALIRHSKTGSLALFTTYPDKITPGTGSKRRLNTRDYEGKHILATTRSLDFPGSRLSLIVKIDRSEAFLEFVKQSRYFSLSLVVILFVIFIVGRLFGKTLSRRLKELLQALMLLYKGEKARSIEPGSMDELGKTIDAYNLLRGRMNKAEEFAIEMSEGNYNYEFETFGERDSLGTSLNVLKDRLIKSKKENEIRKEEDEIRHWINTGIAKFNDLLRQNNDNIQALSYTLIENLITYLQANQGGVFLVEGDAETDRKINMIASFAYDRRKYLKKSIAIGEGILGNVYLEKKSVFLKDIPDDYLEITSGLGQATPRNLYIIPLRVDEEVLGMIEIASFREILPYQIEFLEKVAESIAATFVSVRLNMRTATLLEESKRKAEEIAQQEEEMRQNLEEMQATQEELARLRQEDEKRSNEMQLIVDNTRNLLKNLLNTIPGGYVLKDPNGLIHLINAEGAAFYGKPVASLLGKTDHELLDAETYKKEHGYDTQVLESGEMSYTEEITLKGKKVKVNVIRKQFHIEEIHQLGVLTVRQIIQN
jgi:PAS domain-containing protein